MTTLFHVRYIEVNEKWKTEYKIRAELHQTTDDLCRHTIFNFHLQASILDVQVKANMFCILYTSIYERCCNIRKCYSLNKKK